MIKMTVRELKDKLKDYNDNIEVTIVVVDEWGTKRVGIIDFGVDEDGVYITGVTTNKPYIYRIDD